jgi:hypothetical protein
VVERPSTLPTVVERPSTLPTVVERPSTLPTVVERPSTSPTTVPRIPTSTTSTALDLLDGSRGVATPPGQATIVIGDKATNININVVENIGEVQLDGGFTLRISPSISPIDDDSLDMDQNELRTMVGGAITVEGEDLAPNTEVEVWLNSEPILLGTTMTDEAGRFSAVFDVPNDVQAGDHTLTIVVTRLGGEIVRTSIGLVVGESEMPTEPSTDIGDEKSTSAIPSVYTFLAISLLLLAILVVVQRFIRKRRNSTLS